MEGSITLIRHFFGWLVPVIVGGIWYLVKKINQAPTQEDINEKIHNEVEKLELKIEFLREQLRDK